MRGRWASVISEARKAAALQQQPGQAQQQGQQAQQAPHAQQASAGSTPRGLMRNVSSVRSWGVQRAGHAGRRLWAAVLVTATRVLMKRHAFDDEIACGCKAQPLWRPRVLHCNWGLANTSMWQQLVGATLIWHACVQGVPAEAASGPKGLRALVQGSSRSSRALGSSSRALGASSRTLGASSKGLRLSGVAPGGSEEPGGRSSMRPPAKGLGKSVRMQLPGAEEVIPACKTHAERLNGADAQGISGLECVGFPAGAAMSWMAKAHLSQPTSQALFLLGLQSACQHSWHASIRFSSAVPVTTVSAIRRRTSRRGQSCSMGPTVGHRQQPPQQPPHPARMASTPLAR